nr:MAG TPA_asm: hypothetical protein [Caudoviricetes sp.]
MDTLAPEAFGEEAGEGAEAVSTDADSEGLPASEAEGTGGASEPEGASASGDAGVEAVPPGGGADAQPEGTSGQASGLDASTLAGKFAEISTGIETNINDSLTNAAYQEVQEEFSGYFDALRKHPRMLVGQEVPALQGEGMETLRDSEDAKEWQEAVKSLLSQEISDRSSRKQEELSSTFETLHASVDLFKNNSDLIPGTRQFDRELADQFAALVKDYEVRNDGGKLIGYAVPVQPLINNLRSQLSAQRASRKAAGASSPAAPAGASGSKATSRSKPAASVVDAPQAGIRSAPGGAGGASDNDFSTLFGTIGLPDMVI